MTQLRFSLVPRAEVRRHHAIIRRDGSKATLSPHMTAETINYAVIYAVHGISDAQARMIQNEIEVMRLVKKTICVHFGSGLEHLSPYYPVADYIRGRNAA